MIDIIFWLIMNIINPILWLIFFFFSVIIKVEVLSAKP